MIHGILLVLQETFLNDFPPEKDEPLLSLTNQRIWHPLSRIETWYCRKYKETIDWQETRNAKFVDTCTTLAQRRWIVKSYWWNLFARWFLLIVQESLFRNCIWVCSKEISRSSSHNALDPRSWDSKVNWRTYDITIDCGAKRFPRLRYAWCDDCVCIEKTSQQAYSLPQQGKSRWAASSKIRPILERKTKLLTDLRACPCNRSLWGCTGTPSLVQYTFAEWRCPRLRRSMGSSSITSKRHGFRCDPERIVQRQNYKTLFSFRPSWHCTIKKPCEIMGRQVFYDRRHL